MLSILCGHWRYAHINNVRGDTLNPELLGMEKTVSEDVVRRAMKNIVEEEGMEWLSKQIKLSVEPILSQPWILEIDSSVKAIYGRQQEAEIGYNPKKPGRPSHCYHSYFVANVRLSLGVEVVSGKQGTGCYGFAGLWKRLNQLPRTHWPAMLRGDCAYGNEALMNEAEEYGLPYLFKLRKSEKVKSLIHRMEKVRWQDTADGWEVMESKLKLTGWSKERRVVLVRPKMRSQTLALENGTQLLPSSEKWEFASAAWEGNVAVLVTRAF